MQNTTVSLILTLYVGIPINKSIVDTSRNISSFELNLYLLWIPWLYAMNLRPVVDMQTRKMNRNDQIKYFHLE